MKNSNAALQQNAFITLLPPLPTMPGNPLSTYDYQSNFLTEIEARFIPESLMPGYNAVTQELQLTAGPHDPNSLWISKVN